jgi:hypothetical protein
MARIRTIKPEIWSSESIGRLSRDARLLFVALITQVDDEGRVRASSRGLASLLYPFDDDAAGLIDGWLSELDTEGMFVRYSADGATYGLIPKFVNHQKIDHPTKSKLPTFVESSRILANPRAVSGSGSGSGSGMESADKSAAPSKNDDETTDAKVAAKLLIKHPLKISGPKREAKKALVILLKEWEQDGIGEFMEQMADPLWPDRFVPAANRWLNGESTRTAEQEQDLTKGRTLYPTITPLTPDQLQFALELDAKIAAEEAQAKHAGR